MATPQIRSITVEPPVVPPGGSAVITVDAFDPDEAVVTVSLVVTDKAGNEVTGTGDVHVSDPLTYEASADRGTLTQDPLAPHVFRWQDT